MRVEVRNRCSDFESYRAARVKALFNVETGANFELDAELPIEDWEWQLGVVVGPSGSGKTSIGHLLFDGEAMYEHDGWRDGVPIVEDISPDGDFDRVTGALASVGLGTVPAWLRPYSVLSNGEKFRADLARVICEAPEEVVIDEFSSVVDRQIAKIGALAFQKAWRRTGGRCVLLSCHYDILDWLEPDWVFDTGTGRFQRGRDLWRRPAFHLDIHQTDWSYWPLFEPHHYLKAGPIPGGQAYVGTVNGELVAHLGVTTAPGLVEGRARRLVVMPEWQGAGVGTRFLDHIMQRWLDGENIHGKKLTTVFHTGHPGLAAALRRNRRWVQCSSRLHASPKTKKDIRRMSGRKLLNILRGENSKEGDAAGLSMGGHWRPLQGFRYIGEEKAAEYAEQKKREAEERDAERAAKEEEKRVKAESE